MTVIDLSTPEGKEALAAEIEKATAPLIAKRDELLGEVKKLRKDSQIDPAQLEAVEAERDQFKQQLHDANKALKKATQDAEAATKKAADVDAAYSKSIADSALTEALTKAGVTNPVHLKAAKALLKDSIAVAEENGNRIVKAGDKALDDFTKEWAGSDEGKHFITAADTSGGGSQGGRPAGGSKTIKQSDFDSKAPKDRAALMADGYTVVE